MSKPPKCLSREKLSAAVRNFALAFQQLNSSALPALVAEITKLYKIVNILDKRLKALEPKEKDPDVVPIVETKPISKDFNQQMQEIVNETNPEVKEDGKSKQAKKE